jgi:hypothetical protein
LVRAGLVAALAHRVQLKVLDGDPHGVRRAVVQVPGRPGALGAGRGIGRSGRRERAHHERKGDVEQHGGHPRRLRRMHACECPSGTDVDAQRYRAEIGVRAAILVPVGDLVEDRRGLLQHLGATVRPVQDRTPQRVKAPFEVGDDLITPLSRQAEPRHARQPPSFFP